MLFYAFNFALTDVGSFLTEKIKPVISEPNLNRTGIFRIEAAFIWKPITFIATMFIYRFGCFLLMINALMSSSGFASRLINISENTQKE